MSANLMMPAYPLAADAPQGDTPLRGASSPKVRPPSDRRHRLGVLVYHEVR